jgi:hypothetical protein
MLQVVGAGNRWGVSTIGRLAAIEAMLLGMGGLGGIDVVGSPND